ncbi:hypothetical protein ACO1O0_001415 [Amphichorda felina]
MDGSTTPSPSKRRALAPLDANAVSSPKPAAAFGLVKQHQQHQQPQVYVGASPLRKRAVEASAAAASPRPLKKTCVENPSTRSRSRTPEVDQEEDEPEEDESSLFDNNDASWATSTTPDVSPAPRILTREQAREKAEILRLRLGLASYKVRTGQTSVPLADLVAKPLPSTRRVGGGRRSNSNNTTTNTKHQVDEQDQIKDVEKGEPVRRKKPAAQEDSGGSGHDAAPETVELIVELPQLRRAADDDVVATPRRQAMLQAEEEERLTSSALRGGAASGLLSLARGGSVE